MQHKIATLVLAPLLLMAAGCQQQERITPGPENNEQRQWLAGDHHVHSHYSVGWDKTKTPPEPILAGDAHYSTPLNAQMAALHGLDWIVTTDHGGPNHSQVNLEMAYPELQASRTAVPQVLQFYGMEFDTPSARHCSLIIPFHEKEAQQLFYIESNFNRREVLNEASRDTDAFMIEALRDFNQQQPTPLLLVNHPSRLAQAMGEYKKVTPAKLRDWNDLAPNIVVGMEGAPGHQANALNVDGSLNETGKRGGYHAFPTMGGYDQMTARLGGFWDSMLAEGRKWWITAASDSHRHFTEGRTDFWPGEYSKTYVYAQQNYQSVLQSLRNGHVFVTTGDLIDALYVTVSDIATGAKADIAETLKVQQGASIEIQIRFHDPDLLNFNRENPRVGRVDVIAGNISGASQDRNQDTNATTQVLQRFYGNDWELDDKGFATITMRLDNIESGTYIRVRGTNNTNELEPKADATGENPWHDLWFYSNPVFIKL